MSFHIINIPNFSDSYAFALEFIFTQSIIAKYPDAYIQFVESERGMSLEISIDNKIIYERNCVVPSKRQCIECFFEDMVKKAL